MPPRSLPNLAKPTKIVCLQNMVSPGEVDEELPNEVSSECVKYGAVVKVKIVEIPNVPDENAVRIFIEFSRMEEAMKAVIGLHGRFFRFILIRRGLFILFEIAKEAYSVLYYQTFLVFYSKYVS